MIIYIPTKRERIYKWVKRGKNKYKWFAWYPVIKGQDIIWLQTIYRYRVEQYSFSKGHYKEYFYEYDEDSRREWAKGYYKDLEVEL